MLTPGAASYPPGLAALCRAHVSLRGLRFAWSPLAIASRRPRLAPNPGYCLPARSAAPLSPPTPRLLSVPSPPLPLLLPDGLPPLPPTTSIASSLSDGLAPSEPRSVRADGIPGSERSAAHCHASAGQGSVPRRPGERRAHPVRPSCGACEISRPRQLRPPTAT